MYEMCAIAPKRSACNATPYQLSYLVTDKRIKLMNFGNTTTKFERSLRKE